MWNWKKRSRKGLAVFLALAMCVSMAQLTVFATESADEGDALIVTEADGKKETPVEGNVEDTEELDLEVDTALEENEGSNLEGEDMEPSVCEHVWDEGKVTVAPSCTTVGEILFTCTKEGCNAVKESEIPAEHVWGAGEVTKEATCTEEGERVFTCTVCGEEKVETIPMIGHQDENKDGVCDVCGENVAAKLPEEVKIFLAVIEQLYEQAGEDAEMEELLATYEKAETLYAGLTDAQKELEAVREARAALDTFRETMLLAEGEVVTTYEELKRAFEDATSGVPTEILVEGTIGVEESLVVKEGQDITLTGGELIPGTGGKQISYFTVGQEGSLTLTDITLRGYESTRAPLIMVSGKGAKLVLEQGAVLCDNHVRGDGGAVTVGTGVLHMKGGMISGNSATGYGGGVVNWNTVIMEGGTISGNTSGLDGGGAWNCKGRTFQMTGGTISGNIAKRSGGGVWSESGKLKIESINDIEIVGNTAGEHGGGIYNGFADGATVELTKKAKVSENKAGTGGGGIFTGAGRLLIDGAVISDNVIGKKGSGTVSKGGGISATSCAEIEIRSGKITGNGKAGDGYDTAYYGGGIVLSNSSTLTMSGGEISDNEAKWGGAVSIGECGQHVQSYVEKSVLPENSRRFPDNKLYFKMSGGSVVGNRAELGGGINIDLCNDYVGAEDIITDHDNVHGGLFEMTGGTLYDNYASTYGGGVYSGRTGEGIYSSGVLCNNKADTAGDDIYMSAESKLNLCKTGEDWKLDALHSGPASITGWFYDGGGCDVKDCTKGRWNVAEPGRHIDELRMEGNSVIKEGIVALKAAHSARVNVTWLDGYTDVAVGRTNVEAGTTEVPEELYPDAPRREGYTFIGWGMPVIDAETGDITITAQWRQNVTEPSNVPGNQDTPDTPNTPGTPDTPNPPVIPTPVVPEPIVTPVVLAPAAPVEYIPEGGTPLAVVEDSSLTELSAEEVPLASSTEEGEGAKIVELEDESVPLEGGRGGSWALLNFALMNLALFESVMLLIGYFVKIKNDKNEEEKRKLKKKGIFRLISIPIAVLSFIAFILTENIHLQTGFVDRYTIVMLIIAIVQTVMVALSGKKYEEKEQKA